MLSKLDRVISILVVLLLLLLSSNVSAQNDNQAPTPTRFGWIEPVLILNDQIELQAKLDSGALTSSLDASNIEYFDWNGKPWVRFTIIDPALDLPFTLERPRVRDAFIKRHNTKTQRRPVVLMDICIGTYIREIEVNLVDRSRFLYRMLLGRSALEQIAVIDPSMTLLSQPDCRVKPSNTFD